MHLAHKKILIVFLVAVVLGGFLLSPAPAYAQPQCFILGVVCFFVNWIGETVTDTIVTGIAKIFLVVTTTIPAAIFFLVAGITNWIIAFLIQIPVSPGNSASPMFVQQGWEFTRQFVNIFFLVILVFIGLATILRFREYELQRTLPRLIVVALLVNFSGVLVGFVTDVGNIGTITFTQSIGNVFGDTKSGQHFAGVQETAMAKIDALRSAPNGDSLQVWGTVFALAFALWIFYLFASVMFGILAITFFVRQAILWLLVILAPLAFLAAVLPATRGWWNQWLKALMQWAFIGVPLAFFMWLAQNILVNPVFPAGTSPQLQGNTNVFQDIIAAMITPFTAMIILGLGVLLSYGLAGRMSGAVSGGITKQVRRLPRRTWDSRTVQRAQGKLAGAIERSFGDPNRRMSREMKERADQSTGAGKLGWGAAAAATNITSRIPMFGFMRRKLIETEHAKRRLPLPQGFRDWDPRLQEDWIKTHGSDEDAIQGIAQIAEAGNFRYMSEDMQKRILEIADRVDKMGDRTFQSELYAIRRANPENHEFWHDLSEEMKEEGVNPLDQERLQRIVEASLKATPRKEDFTKDDFAPALSLSPNVDPRHFAEAVNDLRKKINTEKDRLENALNEEGETGKEGLTIDLALKYRLITNEEVQADRAAALATADRELKNKFAQEGKNFSEEIEKHTESLAATSVFVGDMRSRFIQNLGNTTDTGVRFGLAANPQHLRQVLEHHGRSALNRILNGSAGINRRTGTPEGVDDFVLANPQTHNFFDTIIGREFPYAGRDNMRDAWGNPTTSRQRHGDRIRILRLAQEDKNGLVKSYYDILQTQRSAQGTLQRAQSQGAPAADIQNLEDAINQAQADIQSIDDFYQLNTDLNQGLLNKYGIKQMSDPEAEANRRRLTEVRRLLNTTGTASGRRRGGGNNGGNQQGGGRRGRRNPPSGGGGPRRIVYNPTNPNGGGGNGGASPTGGGTPTGGGGPNPNTGGGSSAANPSPAASSNPPAGEGRGYQNAAEQREDGQAGSTGTNATSAPRWLTEGIEKVDQGSIPLTIASRLEKYLQDNGVSQQEINAMDPKTAWQRAKEIRGGSPGPRGPAPQGAAQPLLDLGGGVQVLDMFEKAGRRVFVVKMPDGSVRPFYRSTGQGAPGQKLEGDINPFGGWLEKGQQVFGAQRMPRDWFIKGGPGIGGDLAFVEEGDDKRLHPADPQLRAIAEQIHKQEALWGEQTVDEIYTPERANERLRKYGAIMKDDYIGG